MYKRWLIAGAASIGFGSNAWTLDTTAAQPLAQIVVIGTTPVPGMTVDADKVPANVQTLWADELRDNGPSSLINALATRLSSVNINDTLADPFQPDLLYRGFEASPVLGTPQGLAVYQNGVRINEAFGDTVNWDLYPDIAISRFRLKASGIVHQAGADEFDFRRDRHECFRGDVASGARARGGQSRPGFS